MCSLYLGDQIISGQATLVGESRNIGQIISSTIPLTDAGLHLLDGSLIQGDGIYSAFVDYIAGLYGDGTDVPSYFTDENTWQQSITDYDVCGKFVYDSVNNTVRLPKLYSNERYLIDSSSSGTQWYRVYSDGWCEQGGISPSAGDQTNNTINLLKGYKDTNYSILFAQNAGVEGSYTNGCTAKNKTTSSFVLVYRTSGTASFYWQACGYIDISGYQNTEKYEYIVLATSTKTDIQVDLDNVTTEINNMVSKNDLSEVQCVVETYSNGASWYRVYSDGWCEQGGNYGGLYTSWTTKTFTFLKPFKDTNYSTILTLGYTTYGNCPVVTAKTTDNFTAIIWDTTGTANWQACGYIEV